MGVLAAVLAGATFAFLRFNFHPASIFMGDAGSMLLGFVLACISVQSVMKGTAAIALVLPLLVLGVPFIDLFLIVWRRWRRGVPFYSPGQDHVHHDLVLVHGFSQRKSVLLLYTWCILLSGLAIAMQQQRLAGDRRPRRRRGRRHGVHGAAAQPLPLAASRAARSAGRRAWATTRGDGGDDGRRVCLSGAGRDARDARRSRKWYAVRFAGPRHGRYSVTPQSPRGRDDEGAALVGLGGVGRVSAARRRRRRARRRAPASTGSSSTFPLFAVIGVFAGFALALYAIYLETK